ncbi:Protein CTR9 [Orobanche minor]
MSYKRLHLYNMEANRLLLLIELFASTFNPREYFKQGKVEQFRQILEEGSSPEIDKYYSDGRYERITILTALGAYYSYLGKIETKHREKDDYFVQATTYYNNASRIDMHEPSTWIGKGETLCFYWLFGAKGEVEQAFKAFNIVLDGDCDNVPALLGQENFASLSMSSLYKRALCHYKLGRFEKAKQTRIMLKHLLHLEFRTCKTMKLEELIGVKSDVITAALTAFIPQLVLIEASLKRLPSNTFIEFLKVITEKL